VKVGIIGAGNVGKALAGAFIKAGHETVIAATTRASSDAAAAETGASAVDSPANAATGSQVVVLAVPFGAASKVVDEIGDALAGKVLIDTTNPLAAGLEGLVTYERSGAELIQDRLPEAKVVKAFNYAFAEQMADPNVGGVAIDGYVAGDDQDAKESVLRLAGDIGFVPIDAGPLANARSLENLAFLIISLNAAHGWGRRGAWKILGREPS
jgi:NADPH-dependent F420 reductase